jgi:hypothetical protein
LKFILTVPYFATSLTSIVRGAAGNGSFTMSPTEDGIIRHVPL